ncbi:MAG: tryptophan--tRNA ligase [Proteobacteria bacterium]|nr:tryptophan--tRNA ligase [Pseudomonadota bacterium]
MVTSVSQNKRVVSGMRPTGKLHLGHYHGVLKNWIKLQHEYECIFFVVDWHALTTHYENSRIIKENVWEVVIDWLAAGINPGSAHICIQSWIPEVAELHLLLSMITPLGWLERVPSYKDQQEKLKELDLATYGFLGYSALQAADILLYKASYVPVGEDQVAHIEIAREIARRFNHIYGREPDFNEIAEVSVNKMGKKNAKIYRELRRKYQEQGDAAALEVAQALLDEQQNISMGDRERLLGYLEGSGRIILPVPEVLLTEDSRLPGLDGQKMSKSYHNTIMLREDLDQVEAKIRTMQTDPARVRRTDPGEPDKCPVWGLHKVYSNDEVKNWVQTGCRSAGIGCLDCKKPLIDAVKKELEPIQAAAKEYEANPKLVESIVREGTEVAREQARETLIEVREAIGLDY